MFFGRRHWVKQQVGPHQADGGISGGGGGGGGSPTILNHTGVWAYDDSSGTSYAGGGTASGALVRQWLDFGETLIGSTKVLTDASGGVPQRVQYFDAVKIYTGPNGSNSGSPSIPMLTAGLPESVWYHIPGTSITSANRLKGPVRGDGSFNYFVNLNDSNAVTYLVNYARANYASYDVFFMDDWFYTLGSQGLLFGCQGGYTTTLEVTTDAGMRAGMTTLLSSLTKSGGAPWNLVPNAIFVNPFLAGGALGLGWFGAPNVIGCVAEEAPFNVNLPVGSFPDFFINNQRYALMLDEMAHVVSQNLGKYIFLNDTRNVAQRRRVAIATTLLAHADGSVYLWDDTASLTLGVYPEQGLWPDTTTASKTMTDPVGADFVNGSGAVASSGGHKDLQVATDVYVREFGKVYNQGTAITGNIMAVVMNASGAAVTVSQAWLSHTYGHSITFTGNDVQSGGTITIQGAAFTAGTTQVPARDALLLVV